jgi:glutaredoxin-like protein NrdH
MIEIYTQPNCMPCTQTKKYFENNGIEYISKDVTESSIALQELQDLGFKSTPVIKNGNDVWSGFKPEKLRALL